MRTPLVLAVLLLAPLQAAFAQQDPLQEASATLERPLREIVRGFYFESNLGSLLFLNTHGLLRQNGTLLSGGLATGLAMGGDFIDQERFSAAWEIQAGQALFNGPERDEVIQVQSIQPLVEGDVHAFTATSTLELSMYPSRRLGIGAKAGGGVLYAPVLMEPTAYKHDLVDKWHREPFVHQGPLPMIVIGPSIEYYTRLAHFSVGADVDITYVLDFDLGISSVGYLKYTL